MCIPAITAIVSAICSCAERENTAVELTDLPRDSEYFVSTLSPSTLDIYLAANKPRLDISDRQSCEIEWVEEECEGH